jgi:glutaconate CoA-transferase subunit A
MRQSEAGMNKLLSLHEMIAAIPDGSIVGLGGNTLNRAPMAAVFEMVRQKKSSLALVKTAGAMDIDVLCLAGCVKCVDAGFISYESEFSLAQHYRKSVQKGLVKANEHACYTVISALRAASYGIPFMPVHGLMTSDLIDVNPYFKRITDPFTGDPVTLVSAIKPDFAILHVHKADAQGNALILGPKYEDVLFSRAAKQVILTTEEVVDTDYFRSSETKADIPGFLVSGVAHVPQGAAPCACHGSYDINYESINKFLSIKSASELPAYLEVRHG